MMMEQDIPTRTFTPDEVAKCKAAFNAVPPTTFAALVKGMEPQPAVPKNKKAERKKTAEAKVA
jgi:hypothetical protein